MKNNIKISPYGNLLVYEEGYTSDFVRSTIQKNKLRGLRIFADLKEDRLPDLNFLAEYSFLEVLSITSVDDHDLSFLSGLKGLKELSINLEGKNKIDLSNQVNLEKLAIQWRKGKIFGLEKCRKLTYLCLIDYKENDFLPISQLSGLNELIVKTASVKTLIGLESLPVIEKLVLGNCRSLKSIAAILDLKGLTFLEIDLCTKIEDYSFLSCLSELRTLIIRDSKGIKSISFIQNLHLLNKLSLSGNTDVLDGDMTPLKNVKEVFYKRNLARE